MSTTDTLERPPSTEFEALAPKDWGEVFVEVAGDNWPYDIEAGSEDLGHIRSNMRKLDSFLLRDARYHEGSMYPLGDRDIVHQNAIDAATMLTNLLENDQLDEIEFTDRFAESEAASPMGNTAQVGTLVAAADAWSNSRRTGVLLNASRPEVRDYKINSERSSGRGRIRAVAEGAPNTTVEVPLALGDIEMETLIESGSQEDKLAVITTMTANDRWVGENNKQERDAATNHELAQIREIAMSLGEMNPAEQNLLAMNIIKHCESLSGADDEETIKMAAELLDIAMHALSSDMLRKKVGDYIQEFGNQSGSEVAEASINGVSDIEIGLATQQELENRREANRTGVAVRVPISALQGITSSSHRILSRMDTFHSTGGGSGLNEMVVSTELGHGWSNVNDKLNQPPIYGIVVPDKDRILDLRNGGDWARDYGEVAVILKPEIQDRVTTINGDSGQLGQYGIVMSYEDGEKTAVQRDMAGTLDNGKYVEAQIHGGVEVDDIAEVVIPFSSGEGSFIDNIAYFKQLVVNSPDITITVEVNDIEKFDSSTQHYREPLLVEQPELEWLPDELRAKIAERVSAKNGIEVKL